MSVDCFVELFSLRKFEKIREQLRGLLSSGLRVHCEYGSQCWHFQYWNFSLGSALVKWYGCFNTVHLYWNAKLPRTNLKRPIATIQPDSLLRYNYYLSFMYHSWQTGGVNCGSRLFPDSLARKAFVQVTMNIALLLRSSPKTWNVNNEHKNTWGNIYFLFALSIQVTFRCAERNSFSYVCSHLCMQTASIGFANKIRRKKCQIEYIRITTSLCWAWINFAFLFVSIKMGRAKCCKSPKSNEGDIDLGQTWNVKHSSVCVWTLTNGHIYLASNLHVTICANSRR